jgi:hypothetical protein
MKEKKIKITLITLSILVFCNGFVFLMSSPLKGYANNFDANRYTRCFAIYPVDDALIEKAASIPIKDYIFKGFDNEKINYNIDNCFVSSDLIFQIIPFFYSYLTGSAFPLYLIGVLRLTFIAILFFYSIICQKKFITLFDYLNITIAILLLRDPASLLYFNSFYAEASGFILTSLIFILIGMRNKHFSRNFACIILLLCYGLFFTKKQYIPLSIAFILFVIFKSKIPKFTYIFPLKIIFSLLIISYSSLTLYKFAQYNDPLFAEINKTNSILGYIFKHSNRKDIISSFNLNNKCKNSIGINWFEGKYWNGHPCPEIVQIKYSSIVSFLLKKPENLIHLTNVALLQSKGWINQEYAQTAEGKLSENYFTFQYLFDLIDSRTFTILFYFPLLFLPFSINLFRKRNTHFTTLAIIAISMYISFYSVILGDGLFELTKHLHLFTFIFIYFYGYIFSIILSNMLIKRSHFA